MASVLRSILKDASKSKSICFFESDLYSDKVSLKSLTLP